MRPFNRLAVGSLVMAVVAAAALVLSSVAVIAVFAVGAGHVALNQIKLRGERGRVLAVAAVSIGYAIATFALATTIYYAVTFAAQQAQM
ncbi:hypothetical protein ACQCSU_03125 [Pseudarthrobacter sp. O4]|uniref:hypothetical protein n=1 Tax=Pseudarthrobacter sp. O4 TaxID=3418417 RepID=UPI003CF5B550